MTGLFVSHVSNAVADRNVFTDIGYHGLLTLGGPEYENITITNNYFDGTGITRYWETNALFSQGSRNVLIANNEVTRSSGGGMHIISEPHAKDSEEDYVVNVEYNYVHDFGAGITNDYGAIKTGVKASCDAVPEAEME